MRKATDFIRQVDDLLHAAFETAEEAELVRRLRGDGAMAAEVTLPTGDGEIAGYAALSWMVEPRGWLCLAPMAVNPAIQRQGIGTRLVRMALDWAAGRNAHVVVLGDPEYYGARGFSAARAARLRAPWPAEHLLLAGPGSAAPAATLVYPEAFGVMA